MFTRKKSNSRLFLAANAITIAFSLMSAINSPIHAADFNYRVVATQHLDGDW